MYYILILKLWANILDNQIHDNWVVDRSNKPVEELIKSQLRVKKKLQIKVLQLCIAVNFKT